MTNPRYRTIESPVGFITVAGDEDGTITDIIGTAEQAYVDLGGVSKFVHPDEFFDTSLFIETAKEAGVE